MNISPTNNINTFKGTIIINNLKRNSSINMLTTKEMDKQILDKFQQTLNDGGSTFSAPKKCLTKLKDYVKTISQTTKLNTDKLKYPKADELAVIYNSSKNKTEINIPDFFSITHYLK